MNELPEYIKQWSKRLVETSKDIDLSLLISGINPEAASEVSKVAKLMGMAESADSFYKHDKEQ